MHVMLDLETLGVDPGCVVLSIGAAEFDESGYTGRHFYVNLSPGVQIARGLKVNAETLAWWMRQSDPARERAFQTAPHSVEFSLNDFRIWFEGAETIWGHGLNFDLPIFQAVYQAFGIPQPWGYRAGRDTRTLFDIAGKKMGDFGTPNVLAHDALADAIFQAHETAKCLAYVRDGMREAARVRAIESMAQFQ